MLMVICAGALIARLTYWAVIEHGRLASEAASEQRGIASLTVQPPVRGQIYDASGTSLATNVTMSTVYAAPREIKDPYRTAQLLAPVLGQPAAALDNLFTAGTGHISGLVLVARRVPQAVGQQVQNLALPGIILDAEMRRYYPESSIASQILGFVNENNQGTYGLEQYYDRVLSGKAGLRSALKDTAGNSIHLDTGQGLTAAGSLVPSHNGGDLHLTIDSTVQGLVEDDLQKAVHQHKADGGTIIVMDPRTGYVLGMASTPSFDPNHYWQGNPQSYTNPAIYDLYEPGSTFKIVTMAAGLDTHVITPQSAFMDTGTFKIADRTIHNWNGGGFGWETMTQVLQHSANVGAAWVAGNLGTQRFYTYVKRFHLGQPTGIDLQGEQTGLVPFPGDKTWTIVNLYTNSFGQGLAVTPMQVLTAVSTVANGGMLMKPQMVSQVVYDGRVIDHPPVAEGRVISPATAHTLTSMLVQSAQGGEAQLGLVKGYTIAAKTGTANVAGPDGNYIPGDTIASIVGYAPAYHPRFAVLVKINHPRDTPWGSMAAAPVLHDLFQQLFMHYHLPPSGN